MSQLTDRLERDLREVAAGAEPSPSAWESIVGRLDDDVEPAVALVSVHPWHRSKRPLWLAVAAATLVVIVASVTLLTRDGSDGSISTLAPNTTTFVSPRNGFSVQYVDRGSGTVTPAKQLLGGDGADDRLDDGFDVIETGSPAVFKGGSTTLSDDRPEGMSIDRWVDDFVSYVLPDGCGLPRSQQAEITVDGRSGRIAECSDHIEATVVDGQRLYVFTLSHAGADARQVFDAFLATVDLTPETAVDFPAMTTTFVSPTYGYSFKFHDRGGLAPASERWDPAHEKFEHRNLDDRFDAVETGLLAYFEAASTPIPDGVAIDAWVDEVVTPVAAGGCGVPRSQQADVTVDGQPAKVADCGHSEATVAAGGRLYLFRGPGGSSPRNEAWFRAWLATIDLTPETATAP
jgi:hypothetical protein